LTIGLAFIHADGSEAHRGGQRERGRENIDALHFINAPAVCARQGSVDELAALGLDRRLRLAESIKYQGEAGFCESRKPEKMLDEPGLLMEVDFVAAEYLKVQ
jgi:hypothetical protein